MDKFGFDEDLCVLTYLSNRSHYVDCKGFTFKKCLAASSVPQGSSLRHYCLTSISTNIKRSKPNVYQKLEIITIVNDVTDCLILQSALSEVNKWCSANHLFLNVVKFNAVCFSL